MSKKKLNHKYLISLYSQVDEFLSNGDILYEELPDMIVSFCVVVEKVLKIKLHRKNPFLVFDTSRIKDDTIAIIALKKETDIETARIGDILDRFGIVFKKVFTPDELQALLDIYNIRNRFVHGHKADDKIMFDADDIISKMGTVWEKTSKIAIALLGKENIKNGKPKKKYTEKQLEEVLADEVRKMIEPLPNQIGTSWGVLNRSHSYSLRTSMLGSDKCPRCSSHSFSLADNKNDWGLTSFYGGYAYGDTKSRSNLYKCEDCNLELTEKQYEIAKKINQ